MTGLALSSVSSLRRDIGSQCTVLKMYDGRVFAGSQEGTLACWMADSGETVWQIEMSGPISDIDFFDDVVYVAESAMIHCLEYNSGKMVWSRELEGSSDYVLVSDTGIWATSSVYEIEIGDYTESTIWKFDDSGELQQRWTIGERCWFFGSNDSGLFLGLGRPRCGALRLADGQLEHLEVGAGPVTCGTTASNRILFGHSNGKVSEIGSSSILVGKSPVSSVLGVEGETIAGFESGQVISSAGWSNASRGSIATLSLGPISSQDRGIWVCSDGGVTVLGRELGDNLLELSHEYKIQNSDSRGNLIILGDESGSIYFVEESVLIRRLSDDSANNEDYTRKREMMDRLRRLRRG